MSPETPEAHPIEEGGPDKAMMLKVLAIAMEERRKLDEIINGTVQRAKEAGATWTEIGDVVGITGQAAGQRWSPARLETHRKSQQRYVGRKQSEDGS